jgi:hypothetical protein
MMITRFGALILAGQLAFCLPTAPAQDHLEPEDGVLNQTEREWDYAKNLREALLKDAGRYHLARMVCLPSFEPEWVVTVVREDGHDPDSPPSYYVEYVVTERKLFPPGGSQTPRVKRSRATLDPETAESLNKTWRGMLRRVRYPSELRLGADGVTYHFSRFVPLTVRGESDPLAGWEQGRTWTPDPQSLCGRLVAIGERLKDYAQAKPKNSEQIRSEIRAKLDKLRAELESHKGTGN